MVSHHKDPYEPTSMYKYLHIYEIVVLPRSMSNYPDGFGSPSVLDRVFHHCSTLWLESRIFLFATGSSAARMSRTVARKMDQWWSDITLPKFNIAPEKLPSK